VHAVVEDYAEVFIFFYTLDVDVVAWWVMLRQMSCVVNESLNSLRFGCSSH
jgi:hypothetical protein